MTVVWASSTPPPASRPNTRAAPPPLRRSLYFLRNQGLVRDRPPSTHATPILLYIANQPPQCLQSQLRVVKSSNISSTSLSKPQKQIAPTEHIDRLWWPGHSPEANAIEHAWPWIRRHVTKQFTPSCTARCEKQWITSWEYMPVEVINRWVDAIPEQVRRIIRAGGKNVAGQALS
jgi:hypothetical protein